ncbi:hypothetical protein [Cytobacillus oceanisediminis]|uniref:hypothetical protein n=1 Tax=Cytobacillus oceanisediminis TaxID=665099 RepID=UPI0020401EE4|nr:hypothetical protein [Cytobacillus oceanisediminis]MCM3392680.1 hypothetical protein [Cytobacillus oceanisediminis]
MAYDAGVTSFLFAALTERKLIPGSFFSLYNYLTATPSIFCFLFISFQELVKNKRYEAFNGDLLMRKGLKKRIKEDLGMGKIL